jgi:hypothetical protein
VQAAFCGALGQGEHRAFFRQNLFGTPKDPTTQDVQEVWFAGVHSDVGGSYPEPESQLSKIALRWIVCEAELAGLIVDQTRKSDILGGKPPYVAPDPLTKNQHEIPDRSVVDRGVLAEGGACRSFNWYMEEETATEPRTTALDRGR